MILQYTASSLEAIIYVVVVKEESKFDLYGKREVAGGAWRTCSILPDQIPKALIDKAAFVLATT